MEKLIALPNTYLLYTKMSCIAVPIESYWSNAMFKCDAFLSIFRAAICGWVVKVRRNLL